MASFKILGSTLLTLFARKGDQYSKEKFQKLFGSVKGLLKVGDLAAVAEPCPKAPSEWHVHFWVPWSLEQKRKTIHLSLCNKLQALTGQTNKPNFTKPVKGNFTQKLINDCKYALGRSEKQKDKHHVIATAGIAKMLQILEDRNNDINIPPPELSLMGRAMWFNIERKLSFNQLWEHTLAKKDYNFLSFLAEHKSKLLNMYNVVKEQQDHKQLEKEINEIELWDNQKIMQEVLDTTEPGRQIPCFIDTEGGLGKSTFQDWLHFNRDHQEFTNATTKDIAYAYHGAKNVTFNYSRATDMSKINYQVVENLLDGKVFSSKYESGMKRFKKPLVSIFCNADPDFSKMSKDRWIIYKNIDGKLQKFVPDAFDPELDFTVS